MALKEKALSRSDSNGMTADDLRYALFRHGEIDSDSEKKFLEPYDVISVQQVMDLLQLVILLPRSGFRYSSLRYAFIRRKWTPLPMTSLNGRLQSGSTRLLLF